MLGGISDFLMGKHIGGDFLGLSTAQGGKFDPLNLNPANQPGGSNWLLKNPGYAPVGQGTPMNTGFMPGQLQPMNNAFNNYLSSIGQPQMAAGTFSPASSHSSISPQAAGTLLQLMRQGYGGMGPGSGSGRTMPYPNRNYLTP